MEHAAGAERLGRVEQRRIVEHVQDAVGAHAQAADHGVALEPAELRRAAVGGRTGARRRHPARCPSAVPTYRSVAPQVVGQRAGPRSTPSSGPTRAGAACSPRSDELRDAGVLADVERVAALRVTAGGDRPGAAPAGRPADDVDAGFAPAGLAMRCTVPPAGTRRTRCRRRPRLRHGAHAGDRPSRTVSTNSNRPVRGSTAADDVRARAMRRPGRGPSRHRCRAARRRVDEGGLAGGVGAVPASGIRPPRQVRGPGSPGTDG